MEISEIIKKICYEIESDEQAVALVQSIDSSDDLYELLDHYNWDDGFQIPEAIARHPKCDLAIAQKLFWLAASDHFLEPGFEINEYNQDNYSFSKKLSENIIQGNYQIGHLSHDQCFNKITIHKYKKSQFPEVFYEPVIGKKA